MQCGTLNLSITIGSERHNELRRPNYIQFAKLVHIVTDYITVLHVHQLFHWLSGIAFAHFSRGFEFDSLPGTGNFFHVLCHVFFISFTSYDLGLEFRVRVWLRVSIIISVRVRYVQI